jgi:voltage-gated potassium channel
MSKIRVLIQSRLGGLLKSKDFIVLTFLGNGLIILFSIIVFQIEKDVNPLMSNYIDAVWWTFSTITTVGYGDVVPLSLAGKIIGIFLMLLGTGIFATYTALFANALLGRHIGRLKGEVRYIRSGMKSIEHEEENLESAIIEIKKSLARLEKEVKDITTKD